MHLPELAHAAAQIDEDAAAATRLAVEHGARLPLPGSGDTPTRWAALSAVAEVNLTAARVLEAHCDALAILAEAGEAAESSGSWGVFAAESPTERLDAVVSGDGTAVLTGVKPWCSLAGILDHALVTAHVGDRRQLFRVDLRQPSVTARPAEHWVARGLRAVPSAPVAFDGTPAHPVGAPGWYLARPGFAWGGMGVAACWFGGALGIAGTVRRRAAARPGELTSMHVGSIETALYASRCVLADAAKAIDDGRADAERGAELALRMRNVVADATERVLRTAAHALGPAPLAFDADHACRAADLAIYVRQHHAERDLAALGDTVLAFGAQ